MSAFFIAMVGAFFGAVFGIAGVILYDRFKRPLPDYDFEFKKKVPYQSTARLSGTFFPITAHFLNYIRIKNYGSASLFNVSTKIWFNTRKERRYYQTMEIAEDLFDWEVEHLSVHTFERAKLDTLLSIGGKEDIYKRKMEQGFFVPKSAMVKLKSLSPIKVKVEYTWVGKRFSDIWLFDFSDENEVRFRLPLPTFWQKTKLIFKRIF